MLEGHCYNIAHMNKARVTKLNSYRPYGWNLHKTELSFWIEEDKVRVTSRINMTPTDRCPGYVFLAGEELELLSVTIDGIEYFLRQIHCAKSFSMGLFRKSRIVRTPEGLYLSTNKKSIEIGCSTAIYPDKNSSLKGLYRSGDILVTQCEAEGFRRITYYPDRPDVLSIFKVEIYSQYGTYNHLLSNGNLVKKSKIKIGSRLYDHAIWHDPFLKPCYLFALVIGNLVRERSKYKTSRGKVINLDFYTEPQFVGKLSFARKALVQAMRWDEKRYKRFYDLKSYSIVVASHFNMGAMENKGLNVFNANSVVSDKTTASDSDIMRVKTVVAHEYFHNWSGNRVTCRDWFQLSLKEGLTVFRENLFSEEVEPLGIERIEQVEFLRSYQFSEDASPLAHPVRPSSYEEIDNFYTSTIYDKGAEIIRMIQNYLGDKEFTKGLIAYFTNHDGKAVTIEDMLNTLIHSSGIDLKLFLRWYKIAGTPQIRIKSEHKVSVGKYIVTVEQLPPSIYNNPKKTYGAYQVLPIPIDITLYESDHHSKLIESKVALITKSKQNIVFRNIKCKKITPAFFKGLSAPVNFDYPYHPEQLQQLSLQGDACVRRFAITSIMRNCIYQSDGDEYAQRILNEVIDKLLKEGLNSSNSWGLIACLLQPLDIISIINQSAENVEPLKIHGIRSEIIRTNAKHNYNDLLRLYIKTTKYSNKGFSTKAINARSLAAVLLFYLIRSNEEKTITKMVFDLYRSSQIMTNKLAGLSLLNYSENGYREEAYDDFYNQYRSNQLLMHKWLRLQTARNGFNPTIDFKTLTALPVYDDKNPNCLYSLFAGFHYANFTAFHAINKSGYKSIFQKAVAIDKNNQMVASALFKQCLIFDKFDDNTKRLIMDSLKKAIGTNKMSVNSREVIKNLYAIDLKS